MMKKIDKIEKKMEWVDTVAFVAGGAIVGGFGAIFNGSFFIGFIAILVGIFFIAFNVKKRKEITQLLKDLNKQSK